jgi:hypothetical protein
LPANGSLGHFLRRHRADGFERLHLLPAHRIGLERNRGLHGGQRQQLKHVIGHHIAQRAGFFVEAGAAFHADGFRCRDFHVVDVVAVPDGLKQRVSEAEYQNVLDRFLAQVMIDPEHVFLVERFVQDSVQFLSRFQIVAKGLLEDNPGPAALSVIQPGARQTFHDRSRHRGRS